MVSRPWWLGRQSRRQPSGEQSSLLGEGLKEGSSAYDSANTTITARSISRKLSKTGGIDVIIVGAGLSGLITADELTRAGLNVKVLEANDRGKSIYRSTDGKVKQYNEMIPCGILPSLDLLMATRKINSLSKSVPAKTPCQAKHARYWDERSIGTWIDDTMWTFEAKQLIRMAIKAVYAEDSESISFLDLLATVSGAGGVIEQVLSDAQTTRIVQGPQAISERLAARLPDGTVQLSQKVYGVHKVNEKDVFGETSTYRISTKEGQHYEAPVVIMTPPRQLICQIDFQPPLPSGIIQYYRRQPMGSAIKLNVVYSSPFWRAAGLNGAMINADEKSPVQMTYDNSTADGNHGVIVAFILGNNSRRFLHQNPDKGERKRIVLQFLSTLFGVLTSFEEDERDEMSKVDNLYFGGDATCEIWQGYMEGALLSRRRVASRIVSSFDV
ncbi:related to Monoamine oxidase A [flavin-containing] [Ustilago sp. UG-2017b]|nr:related to Monoamine oxidase A [flavin-containing] [Ustilago sp. UG-2017b]